MYNDPRLKNEYIAWFGLFGFECLPEKITEKLGIEPTETRRKDEYRTIGKGKHERKRINKENAWLLKSELSRSVPIEKHIEHLLNKIKPYKQNFIEIAKQYSFELTAAIYYYEVNPGINLESKILKEIAELNMELGLDIYCLAGTVRQLENKKDAKHLEEQLSGVEFLSKYNEENHTEAQVLVQSLADLEDACYNFLNFHLPDLIWEGKLNDEEYKIRFNKIAEDLERIKKHINQSKYLSSLIDESKKE